MNELVADATMLLAESGLSGFEATAWQGLVGPAGMSAEAYLESEIAKRTKPVTDADVVTFYQANISQMQGRSLEVMAPAINRYLTDQQRATARDAVLAELRKAGAKPVRNWDQ